MHLERNLLPKINHQRLVAARKEPHTIRRRHHAFNPFYFVRAYNSKTIGLYLNGRAAQYQAKTSPGSAFKDTSA
jgi:hypothetical protein